MTRDGSGTSRRRFVKAVGASGTAAGLAGYVGGDSVGAVQQNGTTLQWAIDPNLEGDAMLRPVAVAWPQESSQIAQQVNAAISQGGNPEQAMSQLEQQLQRIEGSAQT